MQLTPQATAIIIACATNIGVLVWNTASQHVRLTAIEQALNNGISDEVKEHGERLSRIEATCEERHAQEVC